MKNLLPIEKIEKSIFIIRGQRVMLDVDLAQIYDVSTKALNQAVKRNLERFPPDFMFVLTKKERNELVTNCDHLQALKFSHTLPHVFTEHGTIMLANVLRSPRAIQAGIAVVRAFIHLRELLATHKDLACKLDELESKYDAQFSEVFDAIRKLTMPRIKKMIPTVH